MCVTTYLLAQIAAWRWKMFKFVCPHPVPFIYPKTDRPLRLLYPMHDAEEATYVHRMPA
jgi:hypothetical protein